MSKKCKKCNSIYESCLESFSKGDGIDGFRSICKKCQLEYNRKYRKENKEKVIERNRDYYRKNKIKIKIEAKKYHKENKLKIKEYYSNNKSEINKKHKEWMIENKDYVKQYSGDYYEKNKESISEWNRKYYEKHKIILRKKKIDYYRANKYKIHKYRNNKVKTDPCYRIRLNLNRRVRTALRSISVRKTNKTMDLLGCSIKEFKSHLESLFLPGMNWSNYGMNGWTLDHVKPCIAFDLTDEKQQKECFNYKNIQPLWKRDNSSKNSMYNGSVIRKQKG